MTDDSLPVEDRSPALQTTFGVRLVKERERAGLSQSEVEARCGIPKTTLSRYENDHILPSIHNLHRLARALGCEEADLVGEDPGPIAAFATALVDAGVEIASNEEARALAAYVAELLAERQTG